MKNTANNLTEKIRVRFAPSPTGNLHVGSVRTAIFNWAYAQATGGQFVLRIEDTDMQRSEKRYEENILDGLTWLGLNPDEGPLQGGQYGAYRQSERIKEGVYQHYIDQLVNQKKAYLCFETEAELEEERDAAKKSGVAYVYSRKALSLSQEQVESKLKANIPYTVRFKIPNQEAVVVEDQLRGKVTFDTSLLSDFIIQKSDGSPSFNFAVVVDDALMMISDVIRGEDHLSNTPKQCLLFEALGFKVPRFCHLPMILGEDRSKLSKRHGASAVTEYKEKGILASSLLNFMSLLGWSHPQAVELFSPEELALVFGLNRLSKSNAIFDMAKLEWMNAQHMRKLNKNEFYVFAWSFVCKSSQGAIRDLYSLDKQNEIFTFLQESIQDVCSINEQLQVFIDTDESVYSRYSDFSQDQLHFLNALKEDLVKNGHNTIERAVLSLIDKQGIKKGMAFKALRLAVTGLSSGHALFKLLELLGKETVLRRLNVRCNL